MIFFSRRKVQSGQYGLSTTTLMIASVITIALSLALLLLWFRYLCGMILGAKPAHDYAPEVAAANELRFLEVQQHLQRAQERRELDTLERKLDRDYYLLSYLLRHGASFQAANDRLEQSILMLDFKLLKAYYTLARQLSRATARRALEEMAQVIGHFANRMGERAACAAVAE